MTKQERLLGLIVEHERRIEALNKSYHEAYDTAACTGPKDLDAVNRWYERYRDSIARDLAIAMKLVAEA